MQYEDTYQGRRPGGLLSCVLLQSARGSLPPSLFQNRTCDFHRIRLPSQKALTGTSWFVTFWLRMCLFGAIAISLTSTTQLVAYGPPLCRRARPDYLRRFPI